MATRIQKRRDIAAAWTAANPVLAQGEEGIELDTGKEKIGNGTTAWNSLPYKTFGITPSAIGAATAAQGAKADSAVQPAGLTKAAVGLGNVDNTSDANKPVSTAQAAAFATAAQGALAQTAIQPGNPALSDARTPTAHKSTHAGGSDALTPADIGAATAVQGAKADSAVQPGALAAVATSGAYSDLSGKPTLGTAAATDATAYATAAQGAKADSAVQPAALNGKADLVNGLVPSSQLPSFVDDVIEGANLAAFPATGESGKIYVALDTGKTYRWSGSTYVEISASPGSTDAVSEGATNLYYTSQRAAADAPVQSVAGKTGAVTLVKGDVGLQNVDNTSDLNKPISSATQAALDGKVGTGDSRLSDSREWSADTISQAEAEAGTATTRRAFTAARVFQAIASWWNGSAAKTKLDGIETGAQVNVATNLSYDDSTRLLSSSTGDDVTLPLVTTSVAGYAPATSFQPLTYAATVNLDLAALDRQYRTLTLAGDVAFTTSNLSAGRMVSIRILPGASQRAFTFPGEWDFLGTKPTTISANKTAALSLTFYGTSNDDCVAAYAVQS